MSRRPNKAEQTLSPEQIEQVNARLSEYPKPTLEQIREVLSGYGLEVSLMAAATFRRTTHEEYLAELRSRAEFAETVAEAAKNGLSMTDAASAVLANKLLDHIMGNGQMELDDFAQLSSAVARLRKGDQEAAKLAKQLEYATQKISELERKAQEYERKRSAAVEALNKAKSGGISEESLARAEEALRLL